MINYIIELALIHLGLILAYLVLLRNEKQYGIMRIFLLGSTFLALFIPVLKFPNPFSSAKQEPNAIILDELQIEGQSAAEFDFYADPINQISAMNLWESTWLFWIYILIVSFFVFKFIKGILSILKLRFSSHQQFFNESKIYRAHGIKGSFSFLKWIFVGDEFEQKQSDYKIILDHEKAHIHYGHSYDIIYLECFKAFFWWLPTSWFVLKEIKKIHEYQADAYALKFYDIGEYSSILISSTLKSNGLSLASSFHNGLIIKRLKAMKQKTKSISQWKMAILSLLVMVVFVGFACNEDPAQDSASLPEELLQSEQEVQDDIFTIVEEQPEFVGGMSNFYTYIMNEAKYPLEARQAGVEGKIFVQWIVEKDGSLTDVQVVKGIGGGLDEEVVRVISNSPKFKPGSQRGKNVRVRMVLPIIFKLDPEKVNDDNSKQGIIIVEDVRNVEQRLKVDAEYNNGEWSGTITDEEGKTLPGVNIVVEGTKVGTVSDLQGKFKVKATKSQNLVISFVGFETYRIDGE